MKPLVTVRCGEGCGRIVAEVRRGVPGTFTVSKVAGMTSPRLGSLELRPQDGTWQFSVSGPVTQITVGNCRAEPYGKGGRHRSMLLSAVELADMAAAAERSKPIEVIGRLPDEEESRLLLKTLEPDAKQRPLP